MVCTPSDGRFYACDGGESWGSFYSLEMTFGGLVCDCDKRILTNVYGHFELFIGTNQEITLVEGLETSRKFY